jgi:hypothetical protein
VEQDKKMTAPDAIIVFSTGLKQDSSGTWIPTDYADQDAFGTLGGIERIRAAAILATEYPGVPLVTTCRQLTSEPPTHASVYANALVALGIPRERIELEERSVNTRTQLQESIRLAKERNWHSLLGISSEFQIPRIQAFWETEEGEKPEALFISAESVLVPKDPAFAQEFEEVKGSPAYRSRLQAEARGIAALKAGTYTPAGITDKKER